MLDTLKKEQPLDKLGRYIFKSSGITTTKNKKWLLKLSESIRFSYSTSSTGSDKMEYFSSTDDKINFMKRESLANIIMKIKTYQQKHYEIDEIPEIQKILTGIEILNEDDLYNLSLEREPREKKK